jgi:PAS domain S-box-containing protein
MQFELWGASSTPQLAFPARPVGYALLVIYLVFLIAALYYRRSDIRVMSSRRWLLLGSLVIVSLIASQLFPVSLYSENQLAPLSSARNPEATFVPFGFVPILLAGAILNPFAAIIVGFAGGLGRALWQSHQIFDPFHFAFAAFLAASLMQQRYSGRLYQWLRTPIVSGLFGALLLLPLIALATLAYADANASVMAAVDLALSTARAYAMPLLIEGVMGGIIVALIIIGLPQLKSTIELRPPPLSNSLNRRLLVTFLLFAGLLSFLLVVIVYNSAVGLSTQIAIVQMAHDAEVVSEKIPSFRDYRQHLLIQTSLDSELLSSDSGKKEGSLRGLFRAGDFYRRIVLVDDSSEVSEYFPRDVTSISLTNLENKAIANTLQTSAPFISPAQATDSSYYVISFVVPVVNNEGETEAVLVGRVPDVSLAELVGGLQGTLGAGSGFIVDEQSQVIAHPDSTSLLKSWSAPDEDQRTISIDDNLPGVAFEGRQGNTNARQLVYYLTGPNHPWTVVITVPFEVILSQAAKIASQLALVLAIAMVLFGGYLLWLGRSLTQPLTELAQVSQMIAGGRLNTPVNTTGSDEIGRLGKAFGQMQNSLKRRLDELSLLLAVSQDVSSSMDINKGMPSILKGALRGTGAAGVRVVVLNPSGRQPIAFGEGSINPAMSRHDRQIKDLLQDKKELILQTPDEVNNMLELEGDEEGAPKSLIAFPLLSNDRFLGIFWVSYRQPNQFDQTELNFLRTLSSQASVLVENSRLYATAEGGRRRLAAVLASTSDAVIVTDPTERILLINPAMERQFGLNAAEVRGRPVKLVIKSERLIDALTGNSDKTHNVEIPIGNDKVLYASASTIVNNGGQAIGRVAVLHDITYLKEIDEMKSEFVAAVSHDLRTPLTFMLGYATMLPMVGDLHPKQLEYVDKITGGIEQMSVLVDDLLDLGRLEAGAELVFETFRVEKVLANVAEDYKQPAITRGNDIVLQVNDTIPPVRGDRSLIRQAVANLVDNAIKYVPNGGQIIIGATVAGLETVIWVEDKGPGISKKDQIRLFEKFYRINSDGADRIKGTGLGLALVRSITERHGGRAWCESEPGKGSKFFISLPLTLQN